MLIEAAAANPEGAVAFQGAPGANSHLAAIEALPGQAVLPCFSFEDALESVTRGDAGTAIIPIENALNGRVADIHFLLPESGLVIVGEHFLPIRHCLLTLGDISEVKQVMSHPQALGQCRFWLREKGIEPIAYADTAGAAAYVADLGDPSVAAIAPKIAADLYGLNLAIEGIDNAEGNVTRFVILAREPIEPPQDVQAMTTFIFEVKNIPAALYKAMGGFATNGVNMTKLESYQRGATFAATEFYADIVGCPGDPAVDRALEELAFHSKYVRILGTYPLAMERG